MNKLRKLAFALSFAFAAACTAGIGSQSSKISCYSNSQGIMCAPAPSGDNSGDPVDLDGDGQDDDYVCSNYSDESNDADGDGVDNDTDTDDDGDGVSDDVDNDDDGDGIDDNDDCDTQGVNVDGADNDADDSDGSDDGTDSSTTPTARTTT